MSASDSSDPHSAHGNACIIPTLNRSINAYSPAGATMDRAAVCRRYYVRRLLQHALLRVRVGRCSTDRRQPPDALMARDLAGLLQRSLVPRQPESGLLQTALCRLVDSEF